MLTRPSKNLTLVVYEDFKSTKCFQLRKSQLKVLFTIIPVLFLLCLGAFISMLLYQANLNKKISNISPELVTKLKEEKDELLRSNLELKSTNEELLQKISSPLPAPESVDGPSIFLFRPSLGAKDLSTSSPIQIEGLELKRNEKNVELHFNIIHQNPGDSRVSGHILVIMKAGQQINVYPKTNEDFEKPLITYNMGEPFTFHRFRPVQASFPAPLTNDKIHFKVFVFSRSGDLLKKVSYTSNN